MEEPKNQLNKRPQNKLYYCILSLPPVVLSDIHYNINIGWRSKYIHSILREKYGSDQTIKIPSIASLARYIPHYLQQVKADKPEVIQESVLIDTINKDISTVKQVTNDNSSSKIDKRLILEGVIRKAVDRISSVELFQKGRTSPNLESNIARYLSVLKDAVETLAKYEGEMPSDDAVIVNIVDNNVQSLLRIFHKLILELTPDKAPEFQARLKQEIEQLKRQVTIQKWGGDKDE